MNFQPWSGDTGHEKNAWWVRWWLALADRGVVRSLQSHPQPEARSRAVHAPKLINELQEQRRSGTEVQAKKATSLAKDTTPGDDCTALCGATTIPGQ